MVYFWPMIIGYDAKRIFHNNTGLGNYGRDVIRILHQYTPISEYILYNTKPSKVNRVSILENILIRYPNNWFWKKFSSLWRLGAVTKQIIKDHVDIYHGLTGEIPAGLKKHNIKTVVTIHDLIFFSHPQYYSFFDRIIYSTKFKHAAVNSDAIIAISEQTKRDIIKYLKVDGTKITVVYQGCNDAFKKQYSQSEKEAVQKKYGLPERFILNVGTLQERKNALSIVKAAHGTPYPVVLIGNEKEYAKKIHTYVGKHGLEKQIFFLKDIQVTELAIIYQLATVFCYPSICEGFGIPIIEALFSKTPVITSFGSCFPEAAGPDSIYVDPLDVDSLRREFQRLFTDDDLRKTTIERGYAFVQKFTDPKVADNVYQVYSSVLNSDKKEFGEHSNPGKNKISALLITYNEIHNIDAVLENIAFADEVIVVDSFSTDGTVERIKQHPNVKLIQRPFKNYTDQKSFALAQANNEWVLFLDADERVTEDLKKEILSITQSKDITDAAYYFRRTFMFQNKVLRFSGWQWDKNYRLFKKDKVRFTEDRVVHETLEVNGLSGVLKNKLIHYSYKDYEDYKGKMIKYGQLKAQEELQKGYTPNPYHFVLKPTYRFVNHFILKLGFLDGKKGLIISYLNALSAYWRYKELKRLQKGLKKKHGED